MILMLIICKIDEEANSCLGVSVTTQEQLAAKKIERIDIQENLICYEDVLTAFDREAMTIYIPYDVTEDTKFHDMKGKLESRFP